MTESLVFLPIIQRGYNVHTHTPQFKVKGKHQKAASRLLFFFLFFFICTYLHFTKAAEPFDHLCIDRVKNTNELLNCCNYLETHIGGLVGL